MIGADLPSAYVLEECEVDLAARELRVRGVRAELGGRAFEVIEVLVQSAGELVTKNELMKRIWPGAFVSENTLAVHVAAVRKALGSRRVILKTESGRGYRLLGDWTVRQHAMPVMRLARPPQMENPPSNMPHLADGLIGRAAALERLHDLLSAYRAVTLTGPGGIGKSALALHAAHGILSEFADGGWLVE
jgi:DNA-binding winged helix-turn-helix (wHTH) protein